MREVTATELHQKLTENIKVIDIRELHEVMLGTIPGIKHIPMYELAYHHQEYLNKTDEYYIVCEHGVRSVNLIQYLTQFGYQLINVQFGTEMYSRTYPLEEYREVEK